MILFHFSSSLLAVKRPKRQVLPVKPGANIYSLCNQQLELMVFVLTKGPPLLCFNSKES
jgi:hypothetical protein